MVPICCLLKTVHCTCRQKKKKIPRNKRKKQTNCVKKNLGKKKIWVKKNWVKKNLGKKKLGKKKIAEKN